MNLVPPKKKDLTSVYYTQPNLPLSSVTFFEDVLRRRQTILSCKIAKRNNETECNVKAETS